MGLSWRLFQLCGQADWTYNRRVLFRAWEGSEDWKYFMAEDNCGILSLFLHITVKREYLAAIIFGGFSNMAIWQRINLAISHTGHI